MATDDEEPAEVTESESPLRSAGKKKKTKKRGKGKKKGPKIKLPKDMVLNDKGEVVTVKEYYLEKT
jgi:hypothetical protein